MTTATALKPYHYPRQYEQLLRETAGHQMQILHRDGLYRHLRFARPGTRLWHWDLITWPGSLAIRGDIGEGLIFTRATDMLGFFDHGQPDGHIDPGYWAGKLDLGCRAVREFSAERFAAWAAEQTHGPNAVIGPDELHDEALDALTADAAIGLCDAADIAWDGDDPERWMDFRYHYILATHAILWGAKRYHAEVPRP